MYRDSLNEQKKVFDVYIEKINSLIKCNETNFYHYTSSNGLKSILENRNIRFSNVEFLNDESELFFTYENIIKNIEELNINDEFFVFLKNTYEKYLSKREREIYNSDYYVASFSNSPDNLNLWNYYTKNRNSIGYNICINVPQFINRNLDALCKIFDTSQIVYGNVIYDTDKQNSFIKSILNDFYDNYINELNGAKNDIILATYQTYVYMLFNYCSIFFKHPAFKEESEFRVVITVGKFRTCDNLKNTPNNKTFNRANLGEIKIRENNGIFIPYIEVPFERNDIMSIMRSPTNKSMLVEKGLKTLLEIHEYNNVEILNSKIPLRY